MSDLFQVVASAERVARMPLVSAWTEKRIEQLRQLVASGLYYSEIGSIMGMTRNAVLGKCHRLGISNGRPSHANAQSGEAKPKKCRPRLAIRPGRKRVFGGPVQIVRDYDFSPVSCDADIPLEQRKSLLELKPTHCKWPIGDPGTTEFFFCGGDAVPGLPYCAGHCRRAYAPSRVRSSAGRATA